MFLLCGVHAAARSAEPADAAAASSSPVVSPSSSSGGQAAGADTCRDCHKDEKFRVQNKKIYDYYRDWDGSAHDLAGITCTACHGGDPASPVKEEAHKGILPQSDPASPFNYKNIPKTCGIPCHAPVYGHFVKSRHYEVLERSGRGPNCITCHGALDAKVYSTTIIERACSKCHNKKTGNHPQVISRAQEILRRLDHANGYRKGLAFYYKAVNKPEAMAGVDAAYKDVRQFWHEFNFEKLDPRSQDLLAELKAIYVKAHEARKAVLKRTAPDTTPAQALEKKQSP